MWIENQFTKKNTHLVQENGSKHQANDTRYVTGIYKWAETESILGFTIVGSWSQQFQHVRKFVCIVVWFNTIWRVMKSRLTCYACNHSTAVSLASAKSRMTNKPPLLQLLNILWRENHLPENTRRVLQPAFFPNKISVSNLSPTIHILEQLIWNL